MKTIGITLLITAFAASVTAATISLQPSFQYGYCNSSPYTCTNSLIDIVVGAGHWSLGYCEGAWYFDISSLESAANIKSAKFFFKLQVYKIIPVLLSLLWS
jgi:hypothetical protein